MLKGLALAIGEAKYEHLARLHNPGNDAGEIRKLLNGLGFNARDLIDRDHDQLKSDLRQFIEDASGADVALVYYAGHAIEAAGENWLVPIDADKSSLAEAAERLVLLSSYLQELQHTVPLTILLLDACRTNPFPRDASLRTSSLDKPVPLGPGGLLVPSRGVTVVYSANVPAAKTDQGTVLGFAAAPGAVALDGPKDGNSPYATALLKHLAAKGLDFGDVLTLVSQEVYVETRGRQIPWVNHNLRQFLYFGTSAESEAGDEVLIRDERRKLLLTIATTPDDRKRLVETLARKDEVPLGALYGMLNMLEIDGPKDPGDLDRQLRTGSEKLRAFLAERHVLKSPDAELARLSTLADEAVGEGAIRAAISFHEKAKARIVILSAAVDQVKADVKARELEFARAFAASAETNILAFDYLWAADDYRMAYERAKTWDRNLALTFKLGQAGALVDHGNYKADTAVLERAIDVYTEAIALSSRETSPDDWARSQNSFGNALSTLGRRESGAVHLGEAVAVYRAALKVWARERVPLEWAATQNNLGVALSALGERERGTARLEEAVAAYRAALEERTRERVPLYWAMTQNNLGIALRALGERERGTARLEEAVAAYRAALEEWTRERMPLEWATAQNNLGIALRRLGERESGTARLEEAIAAHRAALEEWTRERVPLQWATAQNNLGTVHLRLGERESGTARFEEAVAAYRAALEERTRERGPLQWATTQNSLGAALSRLGERESGTTRLEEAVAAYRAALEEWTRERVPLDWAITQNNLGAVLSALGERESGTARLEEAVAAYRAALEERTREWVPLDWAATQNNLGNALLRLGERESGTARLEEAVAAYRAALEEWTREQMPLQWIRTQNNLGNALLILGVRTRSIGLIEEARTIVQSVKGFLRSESIKGNDSYFTNKLTEIEIELARLQLQRYPKLQNPIWLKTLRRVFCLFLQKLKWRARKDSNP